MDKRVEAIQTIDTGDLVKKADDNKKITWIEKKVLNHDVYITTQEFNKLISFDGRLKEVNYHITS